MRTCFVATVVAGFACSAAPTDRAADGPPGGSLPRVVTLITGDRVTLAPDGMVAVAPATLDVPAGGTAGAVVAIATALGGVDGRFTGAVVATANDEVRVTTPIAVEREPESDDLAIRALDRAGALDRDVVAVMDQRLAQPVDVAVRGDTVELPHNEVWVWDVPSDVLFGVSTFGSLATAHVGPAPRPDEVRSWIVKSNAVPFESDHLDPVDTVARQERGPLITGWSQVIDRAQLARVDAEQLAAGESR